MEDGVVIVVVVVVVVASGAAVRGVVRRVRMGRRRLRLACIVVVGFFLG